jgi:hypothetical protein
VVDVESGQWTDRDSHIGGGIDSYYEYLYKCWRLFGDADCKAMWDDGIAAVNRHLGDEVRKGELWYGHADMTTGKRTATEYGALDAFMPALLALAATWGAPGACRIPAEDVAPARDRAGADRLREDAGDLGRLCAATGDHRVCLLPVSLHR